MANLHTRPQRTVLDLTEIADVHSRPQFSARPQSRERTHIDPGFQHGLIHHRGFDRAAIPDLSVPENGAWADLTVTTDYCLATQMRVWEQHGTRADADFGVDIGRIRVDHPDAGLHPFAVDPSSRGCFRLGQVLHRVDPNRFICVTDSIRPDSVASLGGQPHDICQVVLALGRLRQVGQNVP